MVRTYLDWLVELPWKTPEPDAIDVVQARRVLDADHLGLEKVKKRILEFLAVRKLRELEIARVPSSFGCHCRLDPQSMAPNSWMPDRACPGPDPGSGMTKVHRQFPIPKVLAALAAGIKRMLLPARNRKELEFIFLDKVDEALRIAIAADSERACE